MEAFVRYKDWLSWERNDWKPQKGDKVHVIEAKEISKQEFTICQFSGGVAHLKGNRRAMLESLLVKIDTQTKLG